MSGDAAVQRTLRIVVTEDDAFTLSLVAGGLRSQNFEVFTAATIADAWKLIESTDPHALITDLNLTNGESGATLLRRVHEEFPWVGLVALSSHQSPQLAVADAAGIPAGVVYLVKSALQRIEDLGEAVRQAIAGQSGQRVRNDPDDGTRSLTSAQAEVLRMLGHGASTKAIAEHRGTTVRAAETMLARLYSALGLESDEKSNPRVEAVKLWQQGRITVR